MADSLSHYPYLHAAVLVGCLCCVCVIAIAPYKLAEMVKSMRLKEHLAPEPEEPETIIWTEDDPFANDSIAKLPLGLDTTLRDARTWLLNVFKSGKGAQCPCCSRRVQKYRRPISPLMVKALSYIADNPGVTSRDVVSKNKQGGGGDFAKLIHWGFLESAKGFKWYCTEKGRQFLRSDIPAPKYVYLFNDTAYGRSETENYVGDCDKNFSIEDVTNTPADEEVA